jgi:nitrous oxidase accessory protein NosD
MTKTVAISLLLLVALGCTGLGERISRGPIAILSDQDFTPENGVVAGSGLPADPYVIAGWKIDQVGAPYGILIQGTSVPFVIRDVEICGAQVGIKILNAQNGRIEDSLVQGCASGIVLFMAENVRVSSTVVRECEDAVHLFFSRAVDLSSLAVSESIVGVWFTGTTGSFLRDSTISQCDLGAKLELGSEGNYIYGNAFLDCRIPATADGGNFWDDGARGNYWQGFSAPDEDGDGILDQAYPVGVGEDRFPLAAPPGD